MTNTSQQSVDKSTDEHYAAVVCHGDSWPGQTPCGQVPLSESEYDRQMRRPDSLWMCPRCGSTATFDDDYFEKVREIDREPPEPDGECYRGGEAESAMAEEQARIQRELK